MTKALGLPDLHGWIERRILLNYRVDPEVLARQLPAPFAPLVVGGYGLAGVCLIRMGKMRPRFWPSRFGLGSENAAVRAAVTWELSGRARQGVHVSRRDTSSRLAALAGGRIFPGAQHYARFDVRETADQFAIDVASRDGGMDLKLRARLAAEFPTTSVLGSLAAATRFFKEGSVGYSATSDPARFDGMELGCADWAVDPLTVDEFRSNYFDDVKRFPAGSIALDSALLMRNVEIAWRRRADICCQPAMVPQAAPQPAVM
jgi:hypothetical protein